MDWGCDDFVVKFAGDWGGSGGSRGVAVASYLYVVGVCGVGYC